MSTVRDAKGNVLNVRAHGLVKYAEDGLTTDWFDKHPRPVARELPELKDIELFPSKVLPSEADLDAIAEEERIKNATSTFDSGDDVSPVQLPGGRSDEGLAGEPAVPESTVPSDSPEGNVSLENPAGI